MKNGAIAHDDRRGAGTRRATSSHDVLAMHPTSQNGHWVRIGFHCDKCAKDNWQAINGRLRCACGQHCWIERWHDAQGGTRFRFCQGEAVPATFPGWVEITK